MQELRDENERILGSGVPSAQAAELEGRETRPRYSLVTVTYNSERALREFWTPGPLADSSVEWIVVDNGSTDDSAGTAERLGAQVVALKKNLGFSAANNIGLERARGEFIGFVNPDVRVDAKDLPELERTARALRAIVAPQLLNADGTRQPNGRGYPFLWDKVRNRLSRSSRLEGGYLLFPDGSEPKYVCWAMGAAVFGIREDIALLGAWDTRFFLYYEDKDFSLRAWEADLKVVIVPNALWTHGWARETASFRLAPWRRELASMVKFYSRYPEFLTLRAAASKRHPRIAWYVYDGAS